MKILLTFLVLFFLFHFNILFLYDILYNWLFFLVRLIHLDFLNNNEKIRRLEAKIFEQKMEIQDLTKQNLALTKNVFNPKIKNSICTFVYAYKEGRPFSFLPLHPSFAINQTVSVNNNFLGVIDLVQNSFCRIKTVFSDKLNIKIQGKESGAQAIVTGVPGYKNLKIKIKDKNFFIGEDVVTAGVTLRPDLLVGKVIDENLIEPGFLKEVPTLVKVDLLW